MDSRYTLVKSLFSSLVSNGISVHNFLTEKYNFFQNGSNSLHLGKVMANMTAQLSLALYTKTTKGLDL